MKQTEMIKLIEKLQNGGISFEFVNDSNGCHLWYPKKEQFICSVICDFFSYGSEKGLLEIMGLVNEEEVGDKIEGWLTAEEVFNRIQEDYSKA